MAWACCESFQNSDWEASFSSRAASVALPVMSKSHHDPGDVFNQVREFVAQLVHGVLRSGEAG